MDAPFANKLGRFEFRARLGQGGMGVVYRVFDRERGVEVALKTLPSMDADGIYRLKREFRSLAELSHPNLVNLYELFSEEGSWFFTMEWVKGVGFLEWTSLPRGNPHDAETRETPGPGAPAGAATRDETTSDPTGEDPTFRRIPGAQTPSDGAGDALSNPTAEAFERTSLRVESHASGSSRVTVTAAAPALLPEAPPLEKRPARFDEAKLRDALLQLVRGVHALHQAGKEHRDLKPQNVMVSSEGRVVLLDFGLASARQGAELYSEDAQDRWSGTPAYMSPERIRGEVPTEAGDWYAVGVMLYEALTEDHPMEHPGPGSKGEEVVPLPPSALVEGMPEDLSQLALDLLAHAPSRRPGGAEILRRLGEKAASPLSLVQSQGPVFVGRQEQLRVLEQAFAESRERPVVAQVLGTSGFGKTTLVRHFLHAAHAAEGAVVLSGRCYERESVPFKVFDSVIDALSRYLQNLPDPEVAELLPRDVRVLAKLFPPLLRVPQVADAPRTDTELKDVQEIARRASAALKDFFARMAARTRLVLFIDDLQWGDLDSARLLADLLRPPVPPNLLLVVSYRSEELQKNEVLKQLLKATEVAGELVVTHVIQVGPLSREEARELARQVMGGDGAASQRSTDTLIREAAGSPLFVQQLAQYATASQGLKEDEGVSLAEVLRARLRQLPESSRQVLTAVAVAGRPVPQQLVLKAAAILSGADDALNPLRAGNLVRVAGPKLSDSIECYHDKIRETVVADLSREQLRALNEKLARLLETRVPRDPEALMVHWQAAGNLARAANYAIQAALRAAEALAFDRAADLYRIGLQGLPEGHAERPRIQQDMADALRNAGRGPEAADAYLDAAALAGSEGARLDLERLACEQYLVSGYLEKGREVARKVLASVGLSMAESPRGTLASLLWQRVKVSTRGLEFKERKEAEVPRELLRRIDTCWSMATGLSLIDARLGADFTARYLLFALEGGEVGRISRGLALEAVHHSTSGKFERADTLIAAAHRLAHQREDAHARGVAMQMTGFVEYFKGHYRAALTWFDDATRTFRDKCAGVNWELSTSPNFSNWCLLYLGDWDELARRNPELIAEAEQSGNLYRIDMLAMSSGVVTGLRADEVDRVRYEMAEAARRWTPSGFQIQHFLRLYMSGLVDLYAGEGTQALARLREQYPALRASLLLQLEDVRYRIMLLQGYAALEAGDTRELRGLARKSAGVLAKVNSVGAHGVAKVILGALAQREGRPEQALGHFGEAAAEFERAEMALFAAAARWRHGQLSGGDGGREEVSQAQAVMAKRGIKRPDRVLRLLAPGMEL